MADLSSAFKPEQILEILLRRRWFIIVPFCIAMVVGIYMAITLPKIYEANTLILVQPQKVPTNYVQSIVSSDIDSRISTISQQIMSRSNLEKIIDRFDLFSGVQYEKMYFEDKIQALRGRINVKVTRARKGADAFSISFKGKDPQTVMKVANTLASFFIDENLKLREAAAVGTSNFLDVELNSMKVKLEEQEQTLKNYREKYMGGLPEQLDSNLKILERLQSQISSKQESLRDAKARLDAFDTNISDIQKLKNSIAGIENLESAGTDDLIKLSKLKEELEDLKTRYTEKHPDIQRVKKAIMKLEKQIVEDNNSTKESGNTSKQIAYRLNNSKEKIAIKTRRNDLLHEIDVYKGDIDKIQKQIEVYQANVESTPKREQELLSIKRDYSNIKSTYDSLLARKLEAQLAVNMEKKQKGEQFRVLDSARLPEKPVSPDMVKLFLLFVAAGLGVGCGLAYLPEYMDRSFRKPDEIEAYLGLPVLATVPVVMQVKTINRHRAYTVFSIISVLISLALLTCFSLLTFKGVEKTLSFVGKFI